MLSSSRPYIGQVRTATTKKKYDDEKCTCVLIKILNLKIESLSWYSCTDLNMYICFRYRVPIGSSTTISSTINSSKEGEKNLYTQHCVYYTLFVKHTLSCGC